MTDREQKKVQARKSQERQFYHLKEKIMNKH